MTCLSDGFAILGLSAAVIAYGMRRCFDIIENQGRGLMTQDALWPTLIVVALVALLIGMLIGRFVGGARKKADQMAAELQAERDRAAEYRQSVDAHFDKTATLFVSMAGSYKELFDHLSSGYEKLSDKSSRELFRERVDSMLTTAEPARQALTDAGEAPTAAPTETETMAATESSAEDAAPVPAPEAESASSSTDAGQDAIAGEGAPAMPEGEAVLDATAPDEPLLPEAERREKARET